MLLALGAIVVEAPFISVRVEFLCFVRDNTCYRFIIVVKIRTGDYVLLKQVFIADSSFSSLAEPEYFSPFFLNYIVYSRGGLRLLFPNN